MRWILLLIAALAACSDNHGAVLDGQRAHEEDGGPEDVMPTPPTYRAINTNPVPSTGWTRVHTSSHVARDLILPPAGLASFTLSLWVYVDPDEVVSNGAMRILAFGDGHMNASPSADLAVTASAYPDKSLSFSWLWFDNASVLISSLSSPSTRFAPGSWRHVAVVHDLGVSLSLYVGGALLATQSAAGFASTNVGTDNHLSGAFKSSGAVFGTKSGISNIGIFDRAWSADEVAEIARRGREHYYSEASGDWFGETPPVEWSGPAVDGQVPNDGTGADCTFGTGFVVDPFWGVGDAHPVMSFEDSPPTTKARRNNSRGRYPPLHQWLATTGASGSRYALLSPVITRIFFPQGGGWGTGSLGIWIKRPLTPDVAVGTIAQITSGASSITVGLTTGEVPEVTVTDGTHTVSDTLPSLTADVPHWLVLISNHLDHELTVYLDGVAVAVLDTTTVVPGSATTGLSFTVGSNVDMTDPLDIFWTGIGGFEVEITEDDVASLYTGGWETDIRDPIPGTTWQPPTIEDPSGDSPVADYQWRDGIVDGVVPGANTQTPPLVPFSGTEEVVESTFAVWVIGTHRIACSSSAWWPPDAYNPALWTMSYADPDHEAVFGEVPRVVRVTDDPLSPSILIDVDATLRPGIGYHLDHPEDLAGQKYEG